MVKNKFNTETVSASVSKEFMKIIEKNKLSPTDIFRKGMAVELFEMGEHKYKTETNKKRAEYVKRFLDKLDQDEQLNSLFKDIVSFGKILEESENLNS